MPTLRFTGNRTGPNGIWTLKYGPIYVGDDVEVDEATAERWLRPSDAGKCDFSLVVPKPPRKRHKEPVATSTEGA